MKLLSRQEEIVLLCIWRLKDNAYGVTIRELISGITGKYWSIGSIYVPLEKLVDKGYIRPFQGEVTKKRGGRSKRFYKIMPEGMAALAEIQKVSNALWDGFPTTAAEKNEQKV